MTAPLLELDNVTISYQRRRDLVDAVRAELLVQLLRRLELRDRPQRLRDRAAFAPTPTDLDVTPPRVS